jgi:hypothetical protein
MRLSSSLRRGNTEWRSLRATLMTSTSYSSWTHRGKLSLRASLTGKLWGLETAAQARWAWETFRSKSAISPAGTREQRDHAKRFGFADFYLAVLPA